MEVVVGRNWVNEWGVKTGSIEESEKENRRKRKGRETGRKVIFDCWSHSAIRCLSWLYQCVCRGRESVYHIATTTMTLAGRGICRPEGQSRQRQLRYSEIPDGILEFVPISFFLYPDANVFVNAILLLANQEESKSSFTFSLLLTIWLCEKPPHIFLFHGLLAVLVHSSESSQSAIDRRERLRHRPSKYHIMVRWCGG